MVKSILFITELEKCDGIRINFNQKKDNTCKTSFQDLSHGFDVKQVVEKVNMYQKHP